MSTQECPCRFWAEMGSGGVGSGGLGEEEKVSFLPEELV